MNCVKTLATYLNFKLQENSERIFVIPAVVSHGIFLLNPSNATCRSAQTNFQNGTIA